MPRRRSYKYVVVTPHGYSREYFASAADFQSSTAAWTAGSWEGHFVLPKLLDEGWVPVRETPFEAEIEGKLGRTTTNSFILILLEREDLP